MDTIKDMIASKFGTSSDVIKANSEAEAKELSKARERIEELEKAVTDMRRLSLKCAETNELTNQLVQSAIERFEGANGVPAGLSDELKNALAGVAGIKNELEASFKAQEEVIHKENVRVYRNVQASIVDELKQQSEAIAIQHMHIEKKIKGIKPISIIALVFSGISMLGIGALIAYVLIFVGL